MDILKGLNERQKQAVTQTEGPVLILAGAGSGKTKALTHRIAYLIYEKKVNPENILAVTFTNKAAKEMSNRVVRIIGSNTANRLPVYIPWLGTFHSVCVKILHREIERLGYENNFTIYDSDDTLRVVKRVMRELDISEKQHNPRAIASYISGAKGELISAEDYKKYAFEYFQEIVAKVYEKYQKILKSSNALDFDDLIMKTVELFQKEEGVLEKYQNKFKYILVDEYQDTNHAQYIFLKLLASSHQNLFVIGDDWQSIYSFRGAKFQNILDFKKDYPKTKEIYLEENYRSTQMILDAAQNIIKNNSVRSDKTIFTSKDGGVPVTVVSAEEKENEVNFILDEIESLRDGEGKSLNEFVILYRINSQSRMFEDVLLKRGLPYRIIGGIRFYERKEIKDILAYLSLIKNPRNAVALSRVVNVPSRGIGIKSLEKILQDPLDAKKSNPKFKKFCDIIEELTEISKNVTVNELIEKVMDISGYKDFLSDGSFESQGRLENIEELMIASSNYEDLDDFLESVSLTADIDKYSQDDNAITLMTIHAAKGLEFPVVFVSGMEEGVFPHSRSSEDQYELEEERRLLYVGMTRAMQRLYLLFSKTRVMYGRIEICVPSRFIAELPEGEIEIIEI